MSILGMKVYLEIVLGNHCSIELTIQLVSCAHWKTTALSNDSAWNCKDFFLQRVHRYAFFMAGMSLGKTSEMTLTAVEVPVGISCAQAQAYYSK